MGDLGVESVDLRCSSCHWTSENLRFQLAKSLKSSRATKAERVAAAERIIDLDLACKEELYPKHIVQWNDNGWTQYTDYMAGKLPAEDPASELLAKAKSQVP